MTIPEIPFADFLDHAGVAMDDGSMVSARTVRLVEIIRDYDPGLDVEWVPRQHRLPGDDAIRVVDTRLRGFARIVMSFATEEEFLHEDGHPVLERLFLADHSKGDPVARMDARNAAARALELKKRMDQVEERKDIAVHALASPLHRYSARDPATGERKVYE